MAGEAPAIEDSATALAGSRTELDGAWRQFGSARSPEEFCRHWLAVLCHAVSGVHDAVVVLQKPGADAFAPIDRKSTRLNSSHFVPSRMPSSA